MAITSVGQEYDMNLQKTDKIIGQDQELSTETEEHLQILESPNITIKKIGSLYDSIAMSMDIWQRVIRSQQKKKKPESVTSAIKQNILQRTIGQNRR